MSGKARFAASLATLAHRFVAYRGDSPCAMLAHSFAALVISVMLSLSARADMRGMRELVGDGMLTWTGNPTVIYLHEDGTTATETDYDHLVLKFTSTSEDGTITLDDTVKANARILVVGGGGAGGSGGGSGNNRGAGGGGGAGGYLYDSSVALTGGVYTATVGTGGIAAAAGSKTAGGNGQASLFKSSIETLFEAFGGGGGGAESNGVGGDNLGSGGGGSRQYTTTGTTHTGGICTTGQGNNGGLGSQGRTAGGGGGAGGIGGDGTTANVGGTGGAGLQNDITGELLYYAGGGGGGTKGADSDGIGIGGAGGGGNGGGDPSHPTAGASNTGGGGGGGTLDQAGANGGSGVVIVRITQLVETKVPVPTGKSFTFDKSNHVGLDFGIAYTYVDGSGPTNATNAGEYSFDIVPGPGLEWIGGGTGATNIHWSITKRQINKPKAEDNLTYDGTDKVGVTYDEELTEYCTFSVDSVTNATNAGVYDYTVSLNEPGNTAWADGSTYGSIDDVHGSWTNARQKVTRPLPKTDLVYDGTEQQGFSSLDYARYELTDGVTNAMAGGTYSFEFSLLSNNYEWEGTDDPYSGKWTIAPATNAITTLSLKGWRVGTTPNTPEIEASWGVDTVQYVYRLGSIEETNPGNIVDPGRWTITATIPATDNWVGATKTSTFDMWDDPSELLHNWTEISIQGTTSELSGFIVPIRVSKARMPGFSYDEAEPSKMVFVDELGNMLPYDVDTWDTAGESVIWLKLAKLPTAGIKVTLYWNLRDGQDTPENTPADVWSDYAGVWHMSSGNGETAATKDSTGNAAAATVGSASSRISGVVGGALNSTSNSGGPILKIPASDAVNNLTNEAFTASFWARVDNNASGKTGWPVLFARRSTHGTGGYGYGVRVVADTIDQTAGTNIRVYSGSGYYTWNTDKRIAGGKWQRHDVMYKPGRVEWYIDGELRGENYSGLSAWTDYGFISLGGWGGGSDSLVGAVDELRMRSGEINAELIAAEYKYHSDPTIITSGIVYKDDLMVDCWVVEPTMEPNNGNDVLTWDVHDTEKGKITNYGQLFYGEVTNYIYSVYDESEVYSSPDEITSAGKYRAVFTQVDTNGYQRIEKVFEIHVTESKPYSDIVGNGGDSGRVLLMNNHIGESGHPDINYQGWYDADNAGAEDSSTPTYWHQENLDVPVGDGTTTWNLMNGTESVLYAQDGRRLWHIVACRHGNTFPKNNKANLESLQNYLPFDDTYANRITEHDEDRPANRATAGQLVMQNTTDAIVYSSCFTNGIGTIYFDAVNGWKPLTDEARGYYNIVVEIATNTVEGLEPTDINSFTEIEETDPDTSEVSVTTNWYGKLDWHAVPVVSYKRDGTANFEKADPTENLALAVTNGGTMDNFYRVVVPLDIAGPVRFRIRRTTRVPSSSFGVDEGGFILLDNIIASIPAMGAKLVSKGYPDDTKTKHEILGWEFATSVPYPSIHDAEIVGGATPLFVTNVGDGSEPNTNGFFKSATMHYRWRYLNQAFGPWSAVDLNLDDNFKALSKFELPGRACDVEYWYEYTLQAPYYEYVDYSGIGKQIDYSEERGTLTNGLNSATLLPSAGTNWFFRVREGKSDYSGLNIVFRRGTSETSEPIPMMLVDDHVWRGFMQTKEDQAGDITYRIEALNYQTEPFAKYVASTNYLYCKTDKPRFPVSDSLESGSEDSWSTLTLDAVTGYVMFQIDDASKSLTIVHADYQDANSWSDAHGRTIKDENGKEVALFVGTSTTNAYKVGVSPTKQTFSDDFSSWGSMAATNESWTFPVGLQDIQSEHMHGRKPYETFASGSDTNGVWEVGQGMWVAKEYMVATNNAGVALQMEGNGKGYLQFTSESKAPRGLESISFNARLGQFVRFDDFAYYYAGDILSLSNYTFVARTAFDLKRNKGFKGNASLSVIANYLPNKGCYEARWEWIGKGKSTDKGGQRLCLYRWNVTPSGKKSSELIIARTNTVFNVEELYSLENDDRQRFAPLFISVSNDVPNKCTLVVAGIRRCGVKLGTFPIGTNALNTDDGRNANWFGVCFKDTDKNRLTRGSYGVLSANCDGVFARPEFSHTTQTTVGGFPGNNKERDGFDNESLAQVSDLQDVTNCAEKYLKDAEYPGWNIIPGRMTTTYTDAAVNAVMSAPLAQKLQIFLGTAGRADWGSEPYWSTNLTSFGEERITVPFYTTKDCSVRLEVAGTIEDVRTDVVIDSLEMRQWRGGDWNGKDVQAEEIAPSWTTAGGIFDPVFTNFVFTSCWTKDNDILMSAKRSNLETPCAIRSPLMDYMANDGRGGDGYHRGIGLGMISVGYKDAQENAELLLQIATNNVDSSMVNLFDNSFSDRYWVTRTNYNFAAMSEEKRKEGVLNFYFGLHSVTGMMRIVVSTNAIVAVANETNPNRFGDVTITSISCSDEPPVDVHSWWGWNMRTLGGDEDSEKRMLLDDFAIEPGAAGLSLALNNSVDKLISVSQIDVSDRESYIQHKPFVQTPTFTSNIVGEVSFKARKYSPGDEPATVVLFGSKDASETDDGTWKKIDKAVFTVTNDWYETYSYKTDPGEAFKAFRLAVVGIPGIQEDVSGGGNGRVPGEADPPVRVLLDEMFVSEAVRARMGFRNVGCFKSDMAGTDEVLNVPSTTEQPLCGEAWGVQCEIYGAQLASDIDFGHTPQVRLHWFDRGSGGTVEGGVSPWGYDNWQSLAGHNSAWLSPATDSTEGHYVYRSSQRTSPGAVIGASLNPPKYVQYTLEVIYYTKGSTVPTTNWLSAADWEVPSWYRPLDFNASLGKGDSFAAYNILDNVAPGWAWINEVNVFGLFDDALQNTDADCQYVEIVQPPEADISGWSVRILDAQIDNKMVATNTLATFGMGDLAGTKDAKWRDPNANKVFRVIANQQARDTGKLKYEDGTLDGVWHLENINLTNISGDSMGNTEITSYRPFAIQLVRSSGIVEHEIVAMGTNWWWDLPEFLARYHPTNSVNFLNANMARTEFFYVGVDDDGGEPKSLGVFQNNGSATNDWNNTMDKTPGSINKGNGIVQTIGDHPRPNPVNILVYMTVDGSHIRQSLDGTTFTNEMFMLSVPKGSLHGTNVTYCVDPWYVVGSVTTNGASAIGSLTPTVTTQPRQYVLSGVGKGASNNVTVVAMAAPDPRLAELGVDENNPYSDAIVDWLEGGKDLYGNLFAGVDAGEIKLAEFRTMQNAFITNMTLTEMYWLDMDPTVGGLALLGGSLIPPPGETKIEYPVSHADGSVTTNVRMAVYLMITNENAIAPAPTEHKWRGPNDKYTHWTPYVLRGVDPKSNSIEYSDEFGDWPSATFKITARLLNNYTQEDNVANKAPMRLFVFKPDSFTEDGISKVEIEDPYSYPPFVEWWKEYDPCDIGYSWSLDNRKRPMGVEILRQENYYAH